MGASRLAIAGSRAIYSGKIAIPAPSSTSCRCTRGSSVTTRGARSGVTVFPPFESVHLPEPMQRCEVSSAGAAGFPAVSTYLRLAKRSEEHTCELQSHSDLVCRLLLEKKKKKKKEI